MGKEINAVRYLRDKYDIMQKSLICQGISRPYLSNLENGKVEISHEMAYRISEKFNEVFASKGIDLRLDKEDLMNAKRLVTKLELNDELAKFEKIRNVDHEQLKLMEEKYLVVESPYEYARLNGLLGNYYYNKTERRKALPFLIKAFDVHISNNSIPEALSILARVISAHVELNILDRAKAYDDYFFNELEPQVPNLVPQLEEKYYYNSALLNKKLGNYTLAHKRLDRFCEIKARRDLRNDFVDALRANIFMAQQELEKAEETLNNLLDHTADIQTRVYGEVTLLEVLTDMNRKEDFSKKVRSVTYFMRDVKPSMNLRSFFYLTLISLADKNHDTDYVLGNMHDVAEIIRECGNDAECKKLIQIISRYSVEYQEAEKLKKSLINAYFKL
ncbi:helix-turn-helix transcriptional regulator [Fusibacter sp. JL216-2]|uniref:helix-turn-helix transcriptional regulator n=1 Tax=Fusibacter sp. JL216-2 TaxID=3071453 RepID=UPI003D350934